jgi:hypothetical protein
MTPAEIVAIAKDTILAGAGVATVTVAFLGLSTWNRQLRGQADFEAARALAKATYKLREEIAVSRSRLIRLYEFGDPVTRRGGDTGEEYARVYVERWKPVSEALQNFDAAMLEAEALWGEQVRGALDKMHACLSTLSASMDAIVENARSGGEDFNSDPDFGRKMRRNVHASRDDGDELSLEIEAAIAAIEGILRPHLRRI